MMPGKKYTPAEKAAMRRKKAMHGSGISRLAGVLKANASQKSAATNSRKNRKGIEVGSKADQKRVRARLALKYPKDYPGGNR
jgi:hypothetical protein